MTNINLLITGPIRPNIDYINYIINYFKNVITHNVIVFLGYWENEQIDKTLIQNVDYLFNEHEPKDKDIFENISSRTLQQRELHPKIEHWTPRIYKMFYGIRQLVNKIDTDSLINDDDIVLRIRTDLYVEECKFKEFNDLLENIEKDKIYNRIRNHTCDWFSISTYDIFKKIWYIQNDDEYNNVIKNLYNAEAILVYQSKLNNINIVDIRNIIKLCICRNYDNKNNPKLHRYG